MKKKELGSPERFLNDIVEFEQERTRDLRNHKSTINAVKYKRVKL